MAGRNRKTSTVSKAVAPHPIPTAGLVASAVRYPGSAARLYMPSREWQKEAYRHRRICGEARFASEYFGHSLSRCSIYVARPKDGGLEKAGPQDVAALALNDIFSGHVGQSAILHALGVHLTVAGECYLVGRDIPVEDYEHNPGQVDSQQVWEVVSVLEMRVNGKHWMIQYGDGSADVELGDEDVVIRIWRPDPERRMEADSPFRSLLPVLSEIEWLTRHIFAQTSSRLAGAGLLLLPNGMTFPTPPETPEGAAPPENEAESFLMSLAEAMMAPIDDPSNPAALVPTIATGDKEDIAAVRHIKFWSDLDAGSRDMRNDAINRFALGMDLPPEQVLGMGSNPGTGGGTSNGVSHWGAWQIDESTIKLHIEPMLEIICNSLTIGYLRHVTNDDALLRFDTSNLRLRPDRSKESIELYNLGAISMKAMLRENGFDETDIPSDDERKQWLLMKIAGGSATPDQVAAALALLGVDLPAGDVPPEAQEPRETRPAPSLEDHPTRELPEAAALLAASDALVFRALERAGNRLRQTVTTPPPGCPSFEVHTLISANGSSARVLNDAFSCAPQVLEGIADPDVVIPALESYCSTLLAEQAPHERSRLKAWLAKTVLS